MRSTDQSGGISVGRQRSPTLSPDDGEHTRCLPPHLLPVPTTWRFISTLSFRACCSLCLESVSLASPPKHDCVLCRAADPGRPSGAPLGDYPNQHPVSCTSCGRWLRCALLSAQHHTHTFCPMALQDLPLEEGLYFASTLMVNLTTTRASANGMWAQGRVSQGSTVFYLYPGPLAIPMGQTCPRKSLEERPVEESQSQTL